MRHAPLFLLLVLAGTARAQSPCWQDYAVDGFHSVALTNDGRIATWGRNEEGQLGDGTNTLKNIITVSVATGDWVAIASGRHLTMGKKADGTIWSWGLNFFGQLGIGDTEDRNTPVQIGADTDWRSIFGGSNQSFAIKHNGTLWAWGDNSEGEIGDGSGQNVYHPIQIGTDTDWAFVATGMHHELALRTDGSLWGWGQGYTGALGTGTGQDHTTPVRIGTDTWISIAAGAQHSIGVKSDGTLWGTGFGTIDPNSIVLSFTRIGTDNDWLAAAAEGSLNFALKTDGTLWNWGTFLGAMNPTPVQVGSDNDWESIRSGQLHVMARKTDGSLWTWGHNLLGQIGDGTFTDRVLPGEVTCALIGTGVNELDHHDLSVHTDPSGILLWLYGVPVLAGASYTIIDPMGRTVLQGRRTTDAIAISGLAPGAYTLLLHAHGSGHRTRFVKP